MSRTYRRSSDDDETITRPHCSRRTEHPFRCRRCKAMVGPIPTGGKHRNHCPYCLYSRHVDGRVPGDRASTCGAMMAPVGMATRPNGECVVVHRCLACDLERHNRIAADDDAALVLRLPAHESVGPPVPLEAVPSAPREPAA